MMVCTPATVTATESGKAPSGTAVLTKRRCSGSNLSQAGSGEPSGIAALMPVAAGAAAVTFSGIWKLKPVPVWKSARF